MSAEIIHTLFDDNVRENPSAVAVDYQGRKYSYMEMADKIETLCQRLHELKIAKGNVVFVVIRPSEKLITTMLALFKSGIVYLPIDIEFSKKRWSEIFRDNDAECLITDDQSFHDVEDILRDHGVKLPYVFELADEDRVNVYRKEGDGDNYLPFFSGANDYDESPIELDPRDGNYIFYTSGSTGEGKAFLGCHRGLNHFIRWEVKEFMLTSCDKVSMLSQHTFDASLRDVLAPLSCGGTVCIPPRDVKFNIPQLFQWIDESGVTVIHCVPSLFRLMLRELQSVPAHASHLRKLRLIIMAGEILYNRDVIDWKSVAGETIELVNLYGTSETTLAKTCHRIGEVSSDPNQVIHCGKPIEGAFVGIVSGNRLCRIGEIGEIFIKTPYMTKGYLHDKNLHARVFIQNPLVSNQVDIVHKTGDMGRYLHDRSIEVLGRLDNQVKVNGIRVDLNEVDQAVLSMPGIEQAVNIVHKNNNEQNELVCYYSGADVTSDALRDHLKDHLNEGVRPTYIIKLDTLPLNLNGKVDRSALPRHEHFITDSRDYKKPSTDTEIRLEKIWCDILNLKRIGTIAKFFKIGGSSIKAMQLASKIFMEFNVTVKISDILKNGTIEYLSAVIDTLTNASETGIEPLSGYAHYELSHSQKQIWLMCQLQSNHVNYNMTDALVLNGSLNEKAFNDAWEGLITRHESLRTTFKLIDEEPRQIINDFDISKHGIQFSDLTGRSDNEFFANEIAQQEFENAFDLEQGPLLRAMLLKLRDDKYIFVFSVHHIVSDGWSLQIIFKEVAILYNAFVNGHENPLETLKFHYKDFAAWQNKQLTESQHMSEMRDYWKRHFNGINEFAALSYDGDILPERSLSGGRVHQELSNEMKLEIERVSHSNNATVFMTLLAAYYSIIYYYTRRQDIVVACPATNRPHADLENQIGIYLNILPFRVSIGKDTTFAELLDGVRETTINGFDNQIYPFDQIVVDLGISRKNGRNPLTSIMFDMLEFNDRTKAKEIEGIVVEPFVSVHNTNKSDLTMYVTRRENSLGIYIGYNTSGFRKERIELLLRRYCALLDAVVKNPRLKVSELNLEAEPQLKPLHSVRTIETV